MSVFAIGDIHGSYIALKTLLDRLTSKGKVHTYVFLGDYVNKGPQTKEVLDYLIEFANSHQCVFLRGNHDILMLKARDSKPDYNEWLQLGGGATLESYQTIGKNWKLQIPDEHWEFLGNTRSYYKWENKIFVHAGLEQGKNLSEQNSHQLFWKSNYKPKPFKKAKVVFCGHTVQKTGRIRNYKHTILIDTFAWGGGWLTAINVETGKYHQANNSGKLRKGRLEIYDRFKIKEMISIQK